MEQNGLEKKNITKILPVICDFVAVTGSTVREKIVFACGSRCYHVFFFFIIRTFFFIELDMFDCIVYDLIYVM